MFFQHSHTNIPLATRSEEECGGEVRSSRCRRLWLAFKRLQLLSQRRGPKSGASSLPSCFQSSYLPIYSFCVLLKLASSDISLSFCIILTLSFFARSFLFSQSRSDSSLHFTILVSLFFSPLSLPLCSVHL